MTLLVKIIQKDYNENVTTRTLFMIYIIGAILTLLLHGCGPYYNTTYSYSPPTSAEGKRCVNNCLRVLQGCSLQSEAELQNCEDRKRQQANTQYALYLAAQAAEKNHNKSIKTYDEFVGYQVNTCRDLKTMCMNSYRECYTNCGGQVDSESQEVTLFGKPVKHK